VTPVVEATGVLAKFPAGGKTTGFFPNLFATFGPPACVHI
jgi:hypothetical protein